MQPDEPVHEAMTPEGDYFTLTEEDGHYVVRVNGASLMSSEAHGSERLMSELACAPLALRESARVLIGGLGMGFTLRAALDALADDAEVVVAELMPIVVAWNRGVLGPLAGHPLDDPRVRIDLRDVCDCVRSGLGAFDAILLDVDNGPEAFTARGNAWLYENRGLKALRHALRPSGTLVVWSGFESPEFAARMRHAGFRTEAVPARVHGGRAKGAPHRLYVGRRDDD